jgi:tetratricopeptide (TPR) repeat protein
MNKRTLGVLLFLAFGLARVPLDVALTADLRAKGIKEAPPTVSWQEDFGQMFLASLGGLRSLVASVGFLEAYSAWERNDWGAVDNRMRLVTRMQPLEPTYWDEAAWHMAYNAASYYKRDKKLRAAIQNKNFREHVQRGIDILNEGLRYLPDHPRLLETLGYIYKDRQPNPELAAAAFLKAHENGASDFMERLAAYEMVKSGDLASAEKAYEILKRYYDRGPPFTRMESIVRDLRILENRLNIPAEKRLPPAPPPASTAPPRHILRKPNP